jgi:hypothetical protein
MSNTLLYLSIVNSFSSRTRRAYPLQDYRTWKNNLSNEDIAHILFMHAASIYSRGFLQLLTQDHKLNDKDLVFFAEILASTKCKNISIQFDAYFIHRMQDPDSIFLKYYRDISNIVEEEINSHHWSINDIIGSFISYLREILPDNLGIEEDRVKRLMQKRVEALACTPIKDSYYKAFMHQELQQILVRRPLWIQCADPNMFIESFSRSNPHITTESLNLVDINDQRLVSIVPKEGILFLKMPHIIPDELIGIAVDFLLNNSAIPHKTLLVIVEKRTQYEIKHELLDEISKSMHCFPLFDHQYKELSEEIYGDLKVDKTQYFDYFWVD